MNHLRIATLAACGLATTLAVPARGQLRPPPAAPSGVPMAEPRSAPGGQEVGPGSTFAPGFDSWNAAAGHIISQQCVDDGWGWPHASCSTTYHNITGPIAMGLLRAHTRTGDAAHLAAATLAGDFDLLSAYPDINEVQGINIPLTAAGSFTLSFDGAGPTAPLPIATSTDADVKAALEALSTVDTVSVIENLSPRSFVVTFLGALANTDLPLIVVDNALNTGPDITVNEDVAGGGGGEPRFGTFTPMFFSRLSAQTGDPTYRDFAAVEFFDELTIGSYGPNDLDTAGWIASVQAGRAGTWVNLLPWEFHLLITTARDFGNPGQTGLFEQALLDGLNTLDNTDPATVFSDIIGIAGGVRGLALNNRISFPPIASPNHSLVDGVSSLCVLANTLASLQNPDGSWDWHSDLSPFGGATLTDEDTQTTAYAVLALLAAQKAGCGPYATEIRKGRAWLWTMKDVDGGFLSYPTGPHNVEVEGEALEAAVNHPGDVDGNGFVNVFDLITLVSAWLNACTDCIEDFNGDGVIDVVDLLVLLGQWGGPYL